MYIYVYICIYIYIYTIILYILFYTYYYDLLLRVSICYVHNNQESGCPWDIMYPRDDLWKSIGYRVLLQVAEYIIDIS